MAQVFCCFCWTVIWWLQSICQSAHRLVWIMGHCSRSWPEWLFWVGIGTIVLLEMETWCWWVYLGVLVRQAVDQHCCSWLIGVHVWWTWCMPWWIHWIEGNADLRFHVWCPKIYRSQQIGHSHIVGHCQSEGLGMPCSENISFSSKTTLLTLLWLGGIHQTKIIFE